MFSGNRVMILKSKRGIKRRIEQLLSTGRDAVRKRAEGSFD
jgi:hypothetical protein